MSALQVHGLSIALLDGWLDINYDKAETTDGHSFNTLSFSRIGAREDFLDVLERLSWDIKLQVERARRSAA